MIRTVLRGAGLVLCAFGCAVPLIGVSDDAATVLSRHKAFVGWAYGDGTLNSLRETVVAVPPSPKPGATPSPSPKPDRFGPAHRHSEIARRGLLFRESSSAYERAGAADGFTGSLFWRANVNGFTVTVSGHDAKMELTADVIEAEALDEVPSALRPAATFDGKHASVVRITPNHGVPADLFFGEDGALLGFTLDPDGPEGSETIHYVSYAEFQPHKRYPDAIRYGDSRWSYHVDDFRANAAVSDADLHPPAPRATWTFGEPHTIPITVRHSNYGGRSVVFDATINGRIGHFLLDSGAAGILLTDRFAKGAGTRELGQTVYGGVNGGAVAATVVDLETVAIGGNTLHKVIATKAPPIVQGEREDTSTDGIIGFDVLAGSLLDVDLADNRLTLLDPQDNQPVIGKGAYAFALDLSNFHAGVPLKLGNDVLPSVWIDTGNDFFVVLPNAMQSRHAAVVTNKIYFGGVDGIGQYPADCVRFNEIQIGPYRYQYALSCFAPNAAFGKSGGLIGFDFLRHFNWTFDYPHGQLVLTPNGM